MNWVRIRDFLCLAVFAIWWGGLTLYSLVVVPIGTSLFGSDGQGMVTQQVTNWLNWLSLAVSVLLLCQLLSRRKPALFIAWSVLLTTAIALLILHVRLDQMLTSESDSIQDTTSFYQWHRAYLLVTAVQWTGGLIHLAGLSVAIDRHPPMNGRER